MEFKLIVAAMFLNRLAINRGHDKSFIF